MSSLLIGTAFQKSATRILFLGSGELCKEMVIEAQRLGVETIAVDSYQNAPAMQVAHRAHIIYWLAQKLQAKTGILLLNPILITIVIIITGLMVFNIDYETYHRGSRYIDFLLKPAVVAPIS